MKTVVQLLSFDNPVFKAYLFYGAILVLKVLLMAPLTGRHRFSKRIFVSPEDLALCPKSRIRNDDPDIERVRRAHRNDLENIPVYFLAALSYLLTDPNAWLAINLMRAFTFARIAHTLVYAVIVIPQPARAISWLIGYVITGYMAYKSLMMFW